MKLIDTDIVIDHFHGHAAALEYFTENLAAGETLAVSVITLTEVMAGLRPGEEERTERLFQLFAIQDVNEPMLHHGAELITRNLTHYPMTDITVVAPYERGRR